MSNLGKPSRFNRFLLTRWLELKCLFTPAPWRLGSVFHSLAQHPGVWIPFLSLHLIVFWWMGRKFGIPLLFWHHKLPMAFVGGLVTSLTNAFFIFIFFVLDYSDWLDRREMHVDSADGSPEGGPVGRRSRRHWSEDPTRHFNALFREDFTSKRAARPGATTGKLLDFGVEVQHQSFLFRCLTNSFAYLITGIFLLRIGIYFLRPWWSAVNAPGGHGTFDVWNESVRLDQMSWWLFVAGLVAGSLLVVVLDVAKFRIVPRLNQTAMDTPIPVLHWFDKRMVWSPKSAMLILAVWAIALLIFSHAWVQGVGEWSGRCYAAPAFCIMLAWLVLLYGLVTLIFRRPLLAAVVFLPVTGLFLFFLPDVFSHSRYGFRNLQTEDHAARKLTTVCSIFPRTGPGSESAEAQLQADREKTLARRQAIARGRIFAHSDQPANWKNGPLVVICASGGGITAEVWTIGVLHMLDELFPGQFAPQVRLITGASGGMVGAASWVGSRFRIHNEKNLPESPLADRCYEDQLSPLALRFALFDSGIPGFFLQRFVPAMRHWNRGEVLEETWTRDERGILPELNTTLRELLPLETAGKAPSLLFSPAIAEQGRPLVISNLDISQIADITLPEPSPTRLDRVHRMVDARSLLGDQAVDTTPLSTWARMNATFPLVSPPAAIEYDLEPVDGKSARGRIHIVDAAYTDNQGTSMAVLWLRNYWLRWARESPESAPSHVILLELDAFPRYGSRAWSDLRQPRALVGGLQESMEDLRIPLIGLGNRMKSHVFGTDRMLQDFGEEVSSTPGLSFKSFRFVNPIPASLSWFLSPQERYGLKWFGYLFREFSALPPERLVRFGVRVDNKFTREDQALIERATEEAARETGEAHAAPPIDAENDDFLFYSLREFEQLVQYWQQRPWGEGPARSQPSASHATIPAR